MWPNLPVFCRRRQIEPKNLLENSIGEYARLGRSVGQKLKFLMISTFYPPYNFGGDGIFVYRLSNELARRGHQVDVLHCIDAYNFFADEGPWGKYPNHARVTVHPLKSPFGFVSPLLTQQTSYSFFKRKKIKSLIAHKNFDIIHFHNPSLIGLEVLTYGNAIKFYTLHEHWLVCPMHTLWRYSKEICTNRTCISCQIFGKRPVQWWRYSSVMQSALSHIDAFISPSFFAKTNHQQLGLNNPITHIPHFLPTSEDGRNNSLQHGQPYFLFVGRLEKFKGVQNLINVFRNYKKCDLLVAGNGGYATALRKLAADVQNVVFLGRCSYRALRSLYRNALAVIVPSIVYEVFGFIVIEAFAMGTPVIANNLGALKELIEQSGGGFTYSTDEELVNHMEKIRLNPNLRQLLGHKGYQAYRNYWSENYHVNRYYQLIREVSVHKNFNNPAIEGLD